MQSRRARAITAASRAPRQNAACEQWLPPLPRTSGKARRLRTKTAFRQNRRRFPVSSPRETARRGARAILPPLPRAGTRKPPRTTEPPSASFAKGGFPFGGYVRRCGNRAPQNRPHSNRTAQRQVNATMRQHSSNAARQQVCAAAAQHSDNSAQQRVSKATSQRGGKLSTAHSHSAPPLPRTAALSPAPHSRAPFAATPLTRRCGIPSPLPHAAAHG